MKGEDIKEIQFHFTKTNRTGDVLLGNYIEITFQSAVFINYSFSTIPCPVGLDFRRCIARKIYRDDFSGDVLLGNYLLIIAYAHVSNFSFNGILIKHPCHARFII